jgi:ribonuclease VapC
MKPERVVLDAYAVLAFLEQEPAADSVQRYLEAAVAGEVALLMTTVNLGETWYALCRRYGAAVADATVADVMALDIELVAADWRLTRAAAELKTGGGLSFAHCFAGALAQDRDAAILTGDPEFRRLEPHVRVEWLA